MIDARRTVTKADILAGLRSLGLRAGDHVIVHSALSSFGRVAGGAEGLIDVLLAAVGTEGTVLMPTFASPDKVFDPRTSDTRLGAVPRAFWRRKGAVRSHHPLASLAAIGPKAKWLLAGHAEAATAHGKGSPYHRLSELGGKVLLLGVDQDRSTFLHTAEALAHLPYLRPATGKFLDAAGRKRTGTWRHFPGPHRNFIGLQKWMEDRGLTRKARIGRCVAQLMPCRPLLDALLERLRDEPGLFITDNPNLPDGVWQAADVLRAGWRRRPFQLAGDSRFAGRYVEQIIDNLRRFGIDRVVLSFVNDVAWDRIDAARRKWGLQAIRRAKIKVAAVRVALLDPPRAAGLLKEARADTLIVPSTCRLEDVSRLARQGVKVLLENTVIGSVRMAAVFESLRGKAAANVRLAFDPLGFVAAGENPFLRAYQTRLRRHLGGLYVNDGLATGRRTRIGEGLCEIRELVSILCCKSFDGLLVLQSPGEADFEQAVGDFLRMLEEIGA